MTTKIDNHIDNLIYEIDAYVETLEDDGYSIEEIVAALTEYTEIVKELL